jgi:peroxiredoxin
MATFNKYHSFALSLAALMFAGCQTLPTPAVNLVQTQAPFEFKTLKGQSFDLQETIKTHDATVVFWWATQCPCVRRYQSRMEDLRKAYPESSVAMVAMSSNVDDDVASLTKVAKERQFDLPIVIDARSQLSNILSVRTTPTVILIDRMGNVQFKGWIDNERMPGQPGRTPYLQTALDELLAGKTILSNQSPAFGCMITKSVS